MAVATLATTRPKTGQLAAYIVARKRTALMLNANRYA
jgi:hypothetical protein